MENYPHLSEKWLWGISEAITSLSKFPERCQIIPENDAFEETVRQLLYGKKPHIYRILFTIEGENVCILRVRHTRQQKFWLEVERDNE